MITRRITGHLLLITLGSALLLAQSNTVRVTLTITDPTGQGVSHVPVRIVPAPDPSPKMETDQGGKLSLSLKPGGYALFAASSGFKPLASHFDVKASTELQTFSFVLQISSFGGPVEVVESSAKPDLVLLTYPYHNPTGISLSEIRSRPHTNVTIHNPHSNTDETYSGVRVADLLTPLGAPLGKELHGIALIAYLVATGSDGYQVLLSLGEVDPSFHPGEVLVTDTMNGKPLDEHNGPLKLVVTEDKRPARSVRNLTAIELKSAQ